MNKKTIRIAGWALGLSMAVAGIGAAIGSGQKAPIEAKAGASDVGGTAIYTVASKSSVNQSGTWPTSSSATYSQTYSTMSQATSGNSFTLTLNGYDGKQITGLTVSVHSNSSKGAGNLSFVTGDNTIGSIATSNFNDDLWHGSWSSSYVDKDVTCTATTVGNDETVVLTISATANSLYFEKASVTWVTPVTPVASVSLNQTSKSMYVGGDDFQLTATVNPDNATNKNVSWTSSATSVATVSGSGLVHAVAPGDAIITVTTEDGSKTATCAITVTASPVSVDSVSLNLTELELIEGIDGALVATISPANASNQNVSWNSNNMSVATVDAYGVVTAVAPGSAVITVTTEDQSKTATCDVTVVAKSLTGIEITSGPNDVEYGIGETVNLSGLRFTATYDNGDNVPNLTDETVGLTIDKTEPFTKSDLGVQEITVSYGGQTDTFNVTVGNVVIADQKVKDDDATDTLNRGTTGVSGTSYSSWSGKKSISKAVYAGQSAGGNSSIQLRSENSNSGIVTTASGGNALKVTVDWNSNTANGRTLNVYGKNTAYSNATDLYSASSGDLLGTIVNGTSTELSITGDYAYIGLRSNSGAMYLNSIEIMWEGATAIKDDQTVSSSIVDEVNAFVSANMNFGTISISDDTKGTTCIDPNFATTGVLKKFNDLSDNAKLVITSSTSIYDYVNGNLVSYSDVLERLVEWADVNGYNYADGAFSPKGGLGGLGAFSLDLANMNGSLPLIITLVSGGVLLAGGAFLFARRRRNED